MSSDFWTPRCTETRDTFTYHSPGSRQDFGKGKRPIRHEQCRTQDINFRGGREKRVDRQRYAGKRLLFTMLRNVIFTEPPVTNPCYVRYFCLNHFMMYVNGWQLPSESLSLNTASEITCTFAYQTLFSGLGIHHGNTGVQITPDHFMKGSFIFAFDLTPDSGTSDGHIIFPKTIASESHSISTRLSPRP